MCTSLPSPQMSLLIPFDFDLTLQKSSSLSKLTPIYNLLISIIIFFFINEG